MAFPFSFHFLFFLFSFIRPCFSDPRATSAALICSNRTAAPSDRQIFISNFLSAMDAITPQIASRRFAQVIEGTENSSSVFAFGQCMDDLSQSDCELCFAQCKTQIPRCLPFQKLTRGGRNFLDGCYLRYDDFEFFGQDLSPEDKTVCGERDFDGNSTAFKSNAVQVVRNLSVEAPKNNGFFMGFVDGGNSTVYGLAQCWKLVNSSSCRQCLENASSAISSCIPKEEGRVLNAGCYLRYSTQKFYNNSGSGTTGKERKQLGALASTVNKSELNFKYETLERATNYFHSSNKLGQGGSGSVYKGILPDGKVVAIKRLFFNTRQWVDEFFNEVNLISGIHHKNLVKLLGCSITGPESLLVYEYVPNKSLHHHIFNVENARLLSWEVRYNIIVGTAEGLAHLHEELDARIIHRDIKLGNVLLDENFTAKIADFGLARLFPEDKTHISTGIAGTLGYMAPEYLVRGKLTEKADVYSFGVLVIEVICGRRNNGYDQEELSILQMVWNLYTLNKLPEAVDPRLGGRFQEEDASRVLCIGLLCTQASAESRPSMPTVVKMLTDNAMIPSPTQPPFLSSNTELPFMRPENHHSRPESSSHSSGNSMTVTLLGGR
ncbi:cysteine-rich receptor-like protein kinase 3 isoform X2 [Magnolia sinica]|uniref:cysteine-rich receptor-like protein kinase 3 isoform X2 n=1 Tax=Magnolia sinica TaxID=86752 RepID=UPI002659C995|nr:cysteine-rich receptor-like protein kinase 3 isoform X2 [Magnolia sinica]